MGFKDHFSQQAALYRKYRPTYPQPLFDFLADRAERHEWAWDCGTGNGQVAVALGDIFDEVIATDASEHQLALAVSHPRVVYRVAPAEESGINAVSIDLVTAAQAAHWFHIERFYAEVARVLQPGGLLALFCYSLPEISAAVDAQVRRLFEDILDTYWPPERAHVDAHYRTLPFPCEELETPSFTGEGIWTIADLVGYLGSWSATTRYREQLGDDPVRLIKEELVVAWGDAAELRRVRWPIHLRAGRNVS